MCNGRCICALHKLCGGLAGHPAQPPKEFQQTQPKPLNRPRHLLPALDSFVLVHEWQFSIPLFEQAAAAPGKRCLLVDLGAACVIYDLS